MVLVPSIVFASGKPLPRGLEGLGIAVPVALDMTVADLLKVKGKVTRSGKFLSVEADGGYVLSMTLDDTADRLIKISVQVPKGQRAEFIKILQALSEGNKSETQGTDRTEIHTWKDGKTIIRVVTTEDFCRVDLVDFKEFQE